VILGKIRAVEDQIGQLRVGASRKRVARGLHCGQNGLRDASGLAGFIGSFERLRLRTSCAGEQRRWVCSDSLSFDDGLGVVIVIAHTKQRYNAVLRRKRLHLGKHGGAPVAQRLVKPDSQHIGIAAALQDPRRLLHGGAEHPPGLLRVEQLRLLCAQIRRNKQIVGVLTRFYFLFLFRHVSLPASAKQAGRDLTGKRGPQAAYHRAD